MIIIIIMMFIITCMHYIPIYIYIYTHTYIIIIVIIISTISSSSSSSSSIIIIIIMILIIIISSSIIIIYIYIYIYICISPSGALQRVGETGSPKPLAESLADKAAFAVEEKVHVRNCGEYVAKELLIDELLANKAAFAVDVLIDRRVVGKKTTLAVEVSMCFSLSCRFGFVSPSSAAPSSQPRPPTYW